MKLPHSLILAFAFLLSCGLQAAPEVIPVLTTKQGVTYKKATFGKVTKFDVSVTHTDGVARVLLKDLPDEYQNQFQYDEADAKKALEEHNAEVKQIYQGARAAEAAEARGRQEGARKSAAAAAAAAAEAPEKEESGGYLEGIKARAVAKWPDDYPMQVYEVKHQREALQTIAEILSKTPGAKKFLIAAVKRWPDDYYMQAYEMQRQMKAFLQMSNQ